MTRGSKVKEAHIKAQGSLSLLVYTKKAHGGSKWLTKANFFRCKNELCKNLGDHCGSPGLKKLKIVCALWG